MEKTFSTTGSGYSTTIVSPEDVQHGFGWALEQMEARKAVARYGWNGKNMFVYIELGYGAHNAYFVMKTAGGTYQNGWLASATDLLATDWYEVKFSFGDLRD